MSNTIDRQAAIDVLDAYQVMVENGEEKPYAWARLRMSELPSAQPEPCKDAVSRGVYEQTKWERDMAIQQLSDLGYGLGEKIREREDDQQLNEAIKKYAELADYQKEEAEWWDQSLDEYSEVKRDDYLKWSREHKQVANWLMELKRLRVSIPCEDAVRNQPPAQPEIILCKDCKWKQGAECVRFAEVRPFPNDFCSRAERRGT